jgi:hypothetical protein
MDTNKILLTVDDIFRMKGVQPGYDPTDLEYEQAVKTAEDLNKQKLQAAMMPEQSMPQYITLTNKDDNSTIRGIIEGGKFREVPVDKITTPQGTFALQTATNAAPIYLPDGSVAQNYTGDPTMGAPAPTIGGAGMAATNAPTAAPADASPLAYAIPRRRDDSRQARWTSLQSGQRHPATNPRPIMAYNPADFELVETPTGSAPPYNPADFDLVDDGQTGLIEGVGNSIKRGWTMSQMASEMEKPAPDPQRVAALQQEMQAAPPSDEYMTVMDDRRAPEESWTAFKSAPVKVLAELMGESFSAFAGQMIEKAPNRVAIGLGAGAAMGAPVAGIGAVPGGFIGAGAGFAEASGAASYSLEMAGGVLEAMEQAGVPLDNPEALGQALQDPQRMQLAREFAQRKAVPIAIFDGASAVIGGRMFGGGKVTSAMQRLGQGMAETFTQAAMGASGEASGQLAQSGGITSGRAILAEGVAEIPTGLVEIGAGQLSQAGATANQPAATAPAAAGRRTPTRTLHPAARR